MATYTYVDIPGADVALGAPVDSALMTALRDNALAVGENTDDVPDDARITYIIAENSTIASASTVTFSNLDLTRFRVLRILFLDVSATTTGALLFNTTGIVSNSQTSATSGIFEIHFDNEVCVTLWGSKAPFNTISTVTRSTTDLDISIGGGGVFSTGTIFLVGVK